MVIAFFAQISDNAGPGAWMNGVAPIICVFIIFYSFKNGFSNIRKVDVLVFILGLVAISLWIITKNPVSSVVLVSIANSIAFIPTFLKSWSKPDEEALYLYGTNFLRYGASLFAMSNYSLTTYLYPAVLAFNNGSFALFLILRKMYLKNRAE